MRNQSKTRPDLHYVCMDNKNVNFYFRQKGVRKGVLVTVNNQPFPRGEQPALRSKTIATLRLLYDDGLEVNIPIDRGTMAFLMETKRLGQIEHFFTYHNLRRKSTLMWEIKSKFKIYKGLYGLIE